MARKVIKAKDVPSTYVRSRNLAYRFERNKVKGVSNYIDNDTKTYWLGYNAAMDDALRSLNRSAKREAEK